jgi:hypothetical protein
MMATAGWAGAQTPDDAVSTHKAAFDRVAATSEVLSRWSGAAKDGGAELLSGLAKLSPAGVEAARAAETPGALNQAISDKPVTQVLGDPTSDLVFFPLTPCRIIDTRSAAAGALTAGVARGFDSQAPYTAQGGQAASCGIPGSDVPALVLTVVAVGPQGAGDLRIYPFNTTAPNASAINYALPGTGLNIANTTVVPLTQDVLEANEFTILADVAGTHVVADVVGYFAPPTGFQTAGHAFAVVENSATFDATRTKGFASVTRPATGIYCLTPSDATVTPVNRAYVVSVDWGKSAGGQDGLVETRAISASCPSTAQFEVRTFLASTGAATNTLGFHIFVP